MTTTSPPLSEAAERARGFMAFVIHNDEAANMTRAELRDIIRKCYGEKVDQELQEYFKKDTP